MKTLKFPLWQIPGYSMFFGILILFASGTHGQGTSLKPTKETPISESSATEGSISNISSSVTVPPTELLNPKAHTVPKVLVTASSNKETTSISPVSLEHLSTSEHLETGIVTKRTEVVTLKQTKRADATTDIHTSANPETTTTAARALKETEAAKVVGKSPTTVGESTSFSTTAATVGSKDLKPRGRKGENEMSTTPGQRVQEDPTARATTSRRPETQSTTETSKIKESEADTGVTDSPSKGSGGVTVRPTIDTQGSDPEATAIPSKDSRGVTVAIVLSVLLLLVLLLAILFCWRRRRHSGSTTFKMAGWAGKAALPDDSGLDKELEQGALTAGEGETRRATLTTFFGKRQSRVPSVAMEEVIEKETGDVEEAQPLIDGRAPSLEGSGEANGKLPEPTVQCSQETEFPPPPANQEETPPTQLEDNTPTS